MKATFGNSALEEFFLHRRVPLKVGWQACAQIAYRKIVMLVSTSRLEHLRVPPGNRLEALRGDKLGLHSIRINDQWRIIFRWDFDDGAPKDIAIVDYH